MVMQEHIGKTCPYCQFPFKYVSEIIICDSCRMPHHKECWNDNNGCTTFACNACSRSNVQVEEENIYEPVMEVDYIKKPNKIFKYLYWALFLLVSISALYYYGASTRYASISYMGGNYNGYINNWVPRGDGVLTFSDGIIYEGEWINGDLTEGKWIHPDGEVYRGAFQDLVFHGHGKLTLTDNTYYSGEWLNGEMVSGVWSARTISNISDHYVGEFRNGQFHGTGTIYYKTGDIYTGGWKDSLYHGMGEIIYKNNDIFYCNFINGNPVGAGLFIDSSGSRTHARWNGHDVFEFHVPGMNAVIKEIRFYEYSCNELSRSRRNYKYTFSVNDTQGVWWELSLFYPAGSQSGSHTMNFRYVHNGEIIYESPDEVFTINPGWEISWHTWGFNHFFPTLWEKGIYHVQIFINGDIVALGRFEVN